MRGMMKKLSLIVCILAAGCTSKTELGPCIGINQEKRPEFRYEYSGVNIALGIIFSELIAPPIIVVLNELQCPVEKI